MNSGNDMMPATTPNVPGLALPDESSSQGSRPDTVFLADQSGSVMLEFVIAFPLLLVLMFACIQFSQIWTARMVVHYGAFCAARSALVCKTGEYNSAPGKAANVVSDLLRQSWSSGGGDRNTVSVGGSPQWNVTATDTYKLSLVTPIVGQIIAWGLNPWDDTSPWSTSGKSGGNTDSLCNPTIVLKETVTLPKPYVTMVQSGF